MDQCQEDGLEQDHGQAKVDDRYDQRGIQKEFGVKGSIPNGGQRYAATENNLSQKKIAGDERFARE